MTCTSCQSYFIVCEYSCLEKNNVSTFTGLLCCEGDWLNKWQYEPHSTESPEPGRRTYAEASGQNSHLAVCMSSCEDGMSMVWWMERSWARSCWKKVKTEDWRKPMKLKESTMSWEEATAWNEEMRSDKRECQREINPTRMVESPEGILSFTGEPQIQYIWRSREYDSWHWDNKVWAEKMVQGRQGKQRHWQ